jgi:hypothetical protein
MVNLGLSDLWVSAFAISEETRVATANTFEARSPRVPDGRRSKQGVRIVDLLVFRDSSLRLS